MTATFFEVQKRMCVTCIYKSDSFLDSVALEAEIADPHVRGHFISFRVCHHSDTACCHGFWDRHRDDFDLGQVVQRLRLVKEVEHDTASQETVG